jgi:hypothetical protein
MKKFPLSHLFFKEGNEGGKKMHPDDFARSKFFITISGQDD